MSGELRMRTDLTCSATRSGMTLLEVMLALTLTAFVLAAISMAIDLHLRMLDTRRDDVERVQVARAVLNMIAKDLRSAVQPNTTDFSALASMAAGAASGMSGDGAGGDSGGGGGGDSGGMDMGAVEDILSSVDSGAIESATTSVASATEPPPVPGLYGNQYELQVDVSRLPRVDEMQRMNAASLVGPLEDIPSDVKTVAYYVYDPNVGMSVGDFRDRAGNPQSGLVRRVLDRAVTMYASENTNMTSLANVGEVIAPEIGLIQFEYFNGLEWLYEWDSQTEGGLPVAVRITVVLVPEDIQTPGSLAQMTQTELQETQESYSLTVRLPTALPAETTTTDQSGMEAVGL